jgi:hypothetical protein
MKKILVFLLFSVFSLSATSQKISISGYVTDFDTREKLIGAYIYVPETNVGTVTNDNGFYSLTLRKREQTKLRVSFVGYKSFTKSINLKNDSTLNWSLHPSNEIEEITVSAERNIHQTPAVSRLKIPVNDIRIMPTLSGEVDVMKIFQLMPGVQSGQEGSSALYVRGGTHDQNLFLIDGIPLYYVNHLGGYVSVFDDNAVNSMELIKGGFPARYGGRLSSVIDMRMKDGNMKKIGGEIRTGILSSKIFIEGPVKKDKTSFMLSVRRSNIDLATRMLSSAGDDNYVFGYTFYDFFGKVHHKFSDKHALYLMAYSGHDRFIFKNSEEPKNNNPYADPSEFFHHSSHLFTKWGDQMGGLRWSFTPSNKLFSDLSLAYTKFYYNNEQEYQKKDSSNTELIEEFRAEYNSGINDFTAKFDTDYYPLPFYTLAFGAKAAYREFSPGATHYSMQDQTFNADTLIGNKPYPTFESNFYLENKLKTGHRFSANMGLRASAYRSSPDNFYTLQPRAVINYKAAENLSIKAAYSNIRQNLHLLSNSSLGVPTDTWLPPAKDMPPQSSNQYVVNVSYTEKHTKLQIETEGFYKTMHNLIEFKEGMSYSMLHTNISDAVESGGFGRVLGAEFLIRKKHGKTTGWLAYTISKNERRFDNINNGQFFPAQYDRRHDFSLMLNHRFSRKFSVSANWVYTSGNMTTLAEATFPAHLLNPNFTGNNNPEPYRIDGFSGISAYYYGGKNNYRLPPYHRLDINFVYRKQKKRGIANWQIGLYNTYNRKNIFFLYHKNEGRDLYKFTLFPILPSLSYSFKF